MQNLHCAHFAFTLMEPTTTNDLQARITTVFDYAYTSSSIRVPATTCREVGKILHVGMYIEEVEKRVPAYTFSPEDLKKLNGNENAVSLHVAKDIRGLFKRMNATWKLYKEGIQFSDQELAFITGQLSGLFISDPSRDVFGDALEIFRSRWAKQEGGQFFTDARVTHLAVRMLDFNPLRGDDLIDICAGTGGFLLAGLNRIKELVDEQSGNEQQVAKLAAHSLLGQEIDRDVASLGNATLTARTGHYAVSMIDVENSLDAKVFRRSGNRIRENAHLCAATNPPFGAKIAIKNEEILREYELAKIVGASLSAVSYRGGKIYGRAPDVLFVERNVRLLRPGEGRLAIITPYQILSGPQSFYIRDWLLKNCIVEAVVDLPGETFQPHTGTKTSLLMVRRRERPLLDLSNVEDGPLFMATPRSIGHDRRGKPIFEKDAKGHTTRKVFTDFPNVESAFFAFKAGKDPEHVYAECFRVPFESIAKDSLLRLNAQTYRPSRHSKGPNGIKDESDWTTTRIADVVSKISYPGRFKRDYVDEQPGAIPFLGGSNITEILTSTDKWLRPDDSRLDALAIRSGWLLITRSGTTGIVSCVPPAWDGFAMSEHVIRIVPDPKKLDPYYLLAFLRTKRCQEQIKRGVFGSVIDEISPEAISQLEILIPKDKQRLRRIANQMRAAEESRQAAISGIFSTVKSLENLFVN